MMYMLTDIFAVNRGMSFYHDTGMCRIHRLYFTF
jgi:hypothetical protein